MGCRGSAAKEWRSAGAAMAAARRGKRVTGVIGQGQIDSLKSDTNDQAVFNLCSIIPSTVELSVTRDKALVFIIASSFSLLFSAASSTATRL